MKHVLVTGGNGFIGRQAIPHLLERGYRVTVATSRPPESCDFDAGVVVRQCDLLDPADLSVLVRRSRADELLHLAWYTAHGRFWQAAENLDWMRASLQLFREFAANGGRRIVAAGTCAEYDWSHGYCHETTTPLAPHTLYGTAKASLWRTLEAFAGQCDVEACWGRVFLLYGPGEPLTRIVPSVIGNVLRGEEVCCGHGLQYRDVMHVDDVAAGFAALLDSGVTGPVNVASGSPLRLGDLVRECVRQAGGDVDRIAFGSFPSPANDPPLLVADTSRLRDEVGFEPRIDLASGLSAMVDWCRRRPEFDAAGAAA